MREPTEAEVWDRAWAMYAEHHRLWNNFLPEWGYVLPSIRQAWRDRAGEEILRELNACPHTCPKCEATPRFTKVELPPPPTLADDLAALERELVNVKAERDIAVHKLAASSRAEDREALSQSREAALKSAQYWKDEALRLRGPRNTTMRERDDVLKARDDALRERDVALHDLARTQQRLTAAEINAERWREDALKFADQAEMRLENNRRLDEQRKETVRRCETACSEARKDGYRQGISNASEAVHAVLRRDAWSARSWQQAKAARLLTSAIGQRLRKLEQEAAK